MWRPKFTAAWTPREWAEFWLTSFIGFFTFVNAVAAVAYYCTYKQSATDTSRQTDRLICAANIQAQAAKDMSSAASAQAAQMTEMARQTTALSRAADRTAQQAQKANELARGSLVAVQRAFIISKGIRAIKNVSHLPSGDVTKISFIAVWENSGNTPAPRTASHFRHSILLAEPDEQEFIATKHAYTISFVGPKAIEEFPLVMNWEAFDRNSQIIVSTDKHFFFGWNAYRDIFRSKIHVTEFCSQLTSIAVAADGSLGLYANNCERHNCTDEYCADYEEIVKIATPWLNKPN